MSFGASITSAIVGVFQSLEQAVNELEKALDLEISRDRFEQENSNREESSGRGMNM